MWWNLSFLSALFANIYLAFFQKETFFSPLREKKCMDSLVHTSGKSRGQLSFNSVVHNIFKDLFMFSLPILCFSCTPLAGFLPSDNIAAVISKFILYHPDNESILLPWGNFSLPNCLKLSSSTFLHKTLWLKRHLGESRSIPELAWIHFYTPLWLLKKNWREVE